MNKPKFYTIKEFADILKVDETIILEWIYDKILQCIHIEDIIRIPGSELERLLDGLESKNKG